MSNFLIPKSPDEYFKETEPIMKFFYEGLERFWGKYKEALKHWDISKVNEPLTEKKKKDLDEYLKKTNEYFKLKFSEATLCGSIIQVASMGIYHFSTNKVIPDSCKDIVKSTSNKIIKYCIGKEIFDIPAGLIIYAGRNQYNHWDEVPHETTKKVFHKLVEAHYENMMLDLAFDLSNPSITIYANEILINVLKWRTYEVYLKEMNSLIV